MQRVGRYDLLTSPTDEVNPGVVLLEHLAELDRGLFGKVEVSAAAGSRTIAPHLLSSVKPSFDSSLARASSRSLWDRGRQCRSLHDLHQVAIRTYCTDLADCPELPGLRLWAWSNPATA